MTATAMVQDVFETLEGIDLIVQETAKEQEVSTLMMWMLIKQMADNKLDQMTTPYK